MASHARHYPKMAKTSVPPSRDFVVNLRALCQHKGLSDAAVARKAGLPQRTGARLLTGGGDPHLSTVVAVLMVLDVELRELYRPPAQFAQLLADGALAGWRPPPAGPAPAIHPLLHLVAGLTRMQWQALAGTLDELAGHPERIDAAAVVATAVIRAKQ